MNPDKNTVDSTRGAGDVQCDGAQFESEARLALYILGVVQDRYLPIQEKYSS